MPTPLSTSDLPYGSVGRERPKCVNHAIFAQCLDGKWWKVERTEFSTTTPRNFRLSFGTWANTRGYKATTRIDPDGNVYLKAEPRTQKD